MRNQDAYWYLHVGRATDLSGFDRALYRSFEILPGALSILTLAGLVALAFTRPVLASYITIAFSFYWLLKTIHLSAHLRHNFRRLRHNMSVDWNARLNELGVPDQLVHLVIFPYYREGCEVIEGSIRAILDSSFDHSRIAIVLAAEERAGAEARAVGERIVRACRERLLDCILTVHPEGLPGELAGKGSNIAYAAEEARTRILDARGIPYERVIVSAFDIDTVVYPQYFSCLSWHVRTTSRPERASFQPVPLFNNNIWDASTLSRVVAYSSSFWQMIQQERPEKLATFSSHAVLFPQLYEAGYWQKNVISEDSRIFWNLFVRFDGDYRVVPLAYPVSMDANTAPNLLTTMKHIYKQHHRWSYGAENIAYILFAFIKNKRIPFIKKVRAGFMQIEGFWSLATHPLILFAVAWLPPLVGGAAFNATVLSYNLPVITRVFLTLALLGLVVSAAISMSLIPERPAGHSRLRHVAMAAQWALVPITMVVFSAIPGLDAQLRLMTGRYLGFWVTPKSRASSASSQSSGALS